MTRIAEIVDLIIKEAQSRTLPEDYVARLYRMQMDVLTKVNEIMRQEREKERTTNNL